MGQLRTILFVFLFSISALAQIEFNNVIETNMDRQNGLADDVATATRLAESIEAESDDFEKPMTENYKSIQTSPAATAVNGAGTGNASTQERKPNSDKEFSVKLKPTTGADSALRYFPNLKKQKKSSRKIAKASFDKTEDYLTSTKKTKSKKIKATKTAKAQSAIKSKKSKKVAKSDNKKKKTKNRTTASN